MLRKILYSIGSSASACVFAYIAQHIHYGPLPRCYNYFAEFMKILFHEYCVT